MTVDSGGDETRRPASGDASRDGSERDDPAAGVSGGSAEDGGRLDFAVEVDPPSPSTLDASVDRSRIDGMPEGWIGAGEGGADGAGSRVGESELLPDESGISHTSRVQIGTGHSGIVSPSDVLASSSPASSQSGVAGVDRIEEAAAGGSTSAEEETDDDDALNDAGDEWADIVAETRDDAPSESVGFGAFLGAADQADQGLASESYAGDSQGLDPSANDAIDVGAVALSTVVVAATPTPPTRTAGRRPRGGMGPIVGIVLGGLLAIPVTLAILIWGFQRDPFRLTRAVPESLGFLLPAKFRQGGILNRPEPSLAAARTLDSLPLPDGRMAPTDEAGAPIDPAATGESPSSAGDPTPRDDGEMRAADAEIAQPLNPVDVPAGVSSAATEGAEPDVPIAVEAPDLGPTQRTPSSAPALDLRDLDAAIERIATASEALDAATAAADPAARDAASVGWYRALADAALELSNAERAALERSVAATAAFERFDGVRRRLLAEDGGVDRRHDLEELGAMWLASGRRPSAGAVLVGRLDAVHVAGPWWGGRVITGSDPTQGVSFVARGEPDAVAGDRVIVAGVLIDPATMWVSDCHAFVDDASEGGSAAPSEPATAEGAVSGDDVP